MGKKITQSEMYRQRMRDWQERAPSSCKFCGELDCIRLINWFGNRPEYECKECKKRFTELIL